MASKPEQYIGKVQFKVPDTSVGPEERSVYSFPASLEIVEERVELQDFRTSPHIVKGPEGLDVQGFTYINHRTALSDSNQWFTGRNVEEVYIPEVEDLICQITGAKRAVANNIAFRRKLADEQADPKFYYKRGHPLDKAIQALPKDIPLIVGRTTEEALEPARPAHIDYSLRGLRDSARYCRLDIKAAAQPALDAEDTSTADVPRYAAYSVWRPLKTVKRDPLAVCDWRTVDIDKELAYMTYRAPSNVNESGEYLMEAYSALPPQRPMKQKWYWMPEQREDEVLIIKFADTAADMDPNIAGGCPHASPEVEGTENEEPRNSVEVRVLAFW